MNRKNVGPDKATKRIIAIILIGVGLHLVAMVGMDFVNFLFFSGKISRQNEVLIYSIFALFQIGIISLIYRKPIVADWKIVLIIIGVVLGLYLMYPIGII